MIRFALILTLMAGPAAGQNTSAEAGLFVTILPEPRADGAIGEIVHRNRLTSGFDREVPYEFETLRGLVVLVLETTPNNECPGPNGHGCPDRLTVWGLPEGIYASTIEVDTPEQDVSRIILFEFIGM